MVKLLKEVSRILIGVVFIFSGFVKGVDPYGTIYKLIDYFNAFGFSWANSLATVLAIALIGTELLIGISFLLKYKMKFFGWIALLFMAVFLPLTLYIALTNPVTDCGCFGDALIISNWATFLKNIVLTILIIVVFKFRKQYSIAYNSSLQTRIWLGIVVLFSIFINISYNYLPLLDFRPYKVGNNIMEGMTIPEDAPEAIYEYEFVYKNKNTGNEERFTEENYPWKDTVNWAYVSMESELIQKGYEPPIHDFTIENSYGEDVADYYLTALGYTFLLIAYDLENSNISEQSKINKLANSVLENGSNFICLTAATDEQIEEFSVINQPPYEFYFCDEITLKTIIRSNPGLLILEEGTILEKYHWRELPSQYNWQSKLN